MRSSVHIYVYSILSYVYIYNYNQNGYSIIAAISCRGLPGEAPSARKTHSQQSWFHHFEALQSLVAVVDRARLAKTCI